MQRRRRVGWRPGRRRDGAGDLVAAERQPVGAAPLPPVGEPDGRRLVEVVEPVDPQPAARAERVAAVPRGVARVVVDERVGDRDVCVVGAPVEVAAEVVQPPAQRRVRRGQPAE
eukprot:5740265-Prymnesium_polylepis.1